MAQEPTHETSIHGNVEKLTTIGTVNGNVLIVSEKVIQGTLDILSRKTRLAHYPVSDITNYIKVVVKSTRFGRKVQFQVPPDMTISAFIDLVIDTIGLPWSKPIDELMVSFKFRYSVVFGEEKLTLSKTLREAGISDGSEVQLSISSIWTDEIEEAERKEAEMGPVFYEMAGRMRQLMEREDARRARGILTQSKIKSLADSCFAYVDEIGKQ